MVWKAVGILEENCKLKVVGDTYDGASLNRRMFRMHLSMTRDEDINEDVDVTYRIRNVFAEDEGRYIFLIQKTERNCLAHSLAGKCTQSMWNDGYYFLLMT